MPGEPAWCGDRRGQEASASAVDRFDADGVHLGPDDATMGELSGIRQHLRGRILGLSCATALEARIAELEAENRRVGSRFDEPHQP